MGASDEHGHDNRDERRDGRAGGPADGPVDDTAADGGNGRRPNGDPSTNGSSFNGGRGQTSHDDSPANRASTNGATPAMASDTTVLTGRLRVWIDQDLCTGDGICTDHAPDVFTILEDGIAYCQEGDRVFNDPGGSAELAVVPVARETDVVDAAAECPGECIFIEIDAQPELTD